MKAGTLRHQIDIQRFTSITDIYGGSQDTWASIKITRASIKPLFGREEEELKGKYSATSHTIKCRYTDVTAEDRIIYDNRTFQILYVLNVLEKNIELEIYAEELFDE